MLIRPYQLEEFEFAWCYRVYYRWRTYRAAPHTALAKLDGATIDALLRPYDVHVLEATASETDVRMLASLAPAETVSACAGKARDASVNGCVSNSIAEKRRDCSARVLWLHRRAIHRRIRRRYLELQGDHHGYAIPRESAGLRGPVIPSPRQDEAAAEYPPRRDDPAVARCPVYTAAKGRLWPGGGRGHGHTLAADAGRPGHGPGKGLVRSRSCALAVRIHPSVSPASMVVALMNAAQELLWSDFPSRSFARVSNGYGSPALTSVPTGSWNRQRIAATYASGKKTERTRSSGSSAAAT